MSEHRLINGALNTTDRGMAKESASTTWQPRPYSGFWRLVGGLHLAITDQSDRNCGWCWHVSLTEPDRNGETGELTIGGDKKTADEAKQAAEQYAQDFAERTLAALGIATALASERERCMGEVARLREALITTRALVSEAAMTGLNHKDGDWAERLFANQARITAALAHPARGVET